MTGDREQATALLRVRRALPRQPGAVDAAEDSCSREDLRVALAAGDLVVHLQPQMSLRDGRTVGAEALVRWEHPSRGVLAPRDLLPVAERAGLHGPLADVVLDLALAGAARWWSHRAPLPVSVNLAAANVHDPGLTAGVVAALGRHRLPPRALTLEVVEDSLTGTADRAIPVLAGLRALGVAVSVDDYGTGSQPFAALHRLPVDELKLDPVLVADVITDPRSATAVRRVVRLAHGLGLRVVAEGVEDPASFGTLADLGCNAVQGFAVAPAMPVDEFVAWLRERPADGPIRLAGGTVPQLTVPRQRGPFALAER